MMKQTLIKICGFKDAAIAEQTAQAGADYIGLLFQPPYRRCVDINTAKEIATVVKRAGKKTVAVFVHQTFEEMRAICEATGIITVQLHGVTARREHAQLPSNYERLYVASVTASGDIKIDKESFSACNPQRDFLLFDGAVAGSGETYDWTALTRALENNVNLSRFRYFLGGGLNPANVSEAICVLHPNGVDVASGVENAPGVKDFSKITAFIEAVRKQ